MMHEKLRFFFFLSQKDFGIPESAKKKKPIPDKGLSDTKKRGKKNTLKPQT